MKAKIKHLRFGGMGFFLWWILVSWNPITRPYWRRQLRKTLRRIRAKRHDRINAFTWICDDNPRKKHGENAHFNRKIPYKIIKQGEIWEIDFNTLNPKWWKLAKIFIQENFDRCPEDPTDIQFILNMPKYVDWAYHNNINGVTHYYRPAGLTIQRRFAKKFIKMLTDVHGEAYFPFLTFENEANCLNSHERAHMIANRHRNLFLAVEQDLPLTNITVDGTLCNSAVAHLVERHACPKYDPDHPVPYCNGFFGDDRFLEPVTKRRQVEVTDHGKALKENFLIGFPDWLGSAWISGEWHGDGGCGKEYFPIANGVKLRNSSGQITHAWGDAAQVRKKCDHVWTQAKRKGKDAFISLVYPETLKKNSQGIYIEDFRVKVIDWTRVNAAINSHKKIYNHD